MHSKVRTRNVKEVNVDLLGISEFMLKVLLKHLQAI
jgi:hypothetical protein